MTTDFIIVCKAWEKICAVEGIPPISDDDYEFIKTLAGLPSAERIRRVKARIKGEAP